MELIKLPGFDVGKMVGSGKDGLPLILVLQAQVLIKYLFLFNAGLSKTH